MSEIWKPVVGFEGAYEVSDLGRVRSLDRVVMRSDGRRTRIKGCAIKGSNALEKAPYIVVTFPRNERRYVQDLVMAAFVGPKPNGALTLHGNDIKHDNRLSNLYYGDQCQNMADKDRNGNQAWAEKHQSASFSDASVRKVRGLKGAMSAVGVSALIGMSDGYVRAIWRGDARPRG